MHTLVVCTKNRKTDLQNLMDSVSKLDPNFDEIIIIDSSRDEERSILDTGFKNVLVNYLDVGLSEARNIGLSLVKNETNFVHFLDDDVVLETDYLLKVNIFFKNYPGASGVTGCDLNLTSKKNLKILFLKLYLLLFRKQGKFSKFGFNFGNYWNGGTYLVDWLPGCNMVFKTNIAKKYLFKRTINATFCEDLVYGLDVSKEHDLYFCNKIKYRHNLSPINRMGRSKKRQSHYFNLNYLLNNYTSYVNVFALKLRLIFIKFLLLLTVKNDQ